MKVRLHLCLVTLNVAAIAPSAAQIASDGSLPERNKFDSVEVVTKAKTDIDLRQRSLVAKRIYGREELNRFGDNNMLEVLSNIPGVQIHNGAPALSGLDPKYTKLLFNGDPAPAGATMEQIPPAQIDRVEITRGQTANQSAQSIGGTINIIFKEAPRKSSETIRYGVNYQNERLTPAVTYTLGGKTGDLAYTIPISVNELLQTYQVNSDKRVTEPNGTLSSGYQEKYWRYGLVSLTTSPQINYTINDDEKLRSQNYIASFTRKLRHQFDKVIFAGDPQLDNDFESQTDVKIIRSNLSWVKTLSANDQMETKFGVNLMDSGANWLTKNQTAQITSGYQEKRDSGIRFTSNYTHLHNSSHLVTAGVELDKKWQTELVRELLLGEPVNPLGFNQTFKGAVVSSAAFIQDEWEISKKLSVNLGLRSENLELTSEGPPNLTGIDNTSASATNRTAIVAPVMHFSYRPVEGSKQVLRGSVSKGYKAPDISALGLIPSLVVRDTTVTNSAMTPDIVGNSALRPEVATGFDLSYETSFGKNGHLSIGTFYRDVEDIVVDITSLRSVYWSAQPRWVNQPTNYSHGKSYGVEFEMRAAASDVLPSALTPSKPLNLRLNLNVYGSQVDAVAGPNNRFPLQSPWKATFGFDYRPIAGLTLGGAVFVSPEYETRISWSDRTIQRPLRWVNAFAQYAINKNSSLRVGMNNVFPSANATEAFSEFSDKRSVRSGRTALTVSFESTL